MEARAGRRQQQPSWPSPEPATGAVGSHECCCGGVEGGEEEGNARRGSSEGSRALATVWVVIACLSFPTVVFVSGVYGPPLALFSGLRRQGLPHQRQANGDRLLGGLLADGFDGGESCLSRREAHLYRRPSPFRPSPHLVASLRRYEALHRRCNPGGGRYNETLRLLTSSPGGSHPAGAPAPACRYLVWTPENGLGNRMISLASAFLYALLAGRVLLIDRSMDMAALFCEPFPGGGTTTTTTTTTTWLLPLDFPVEHPFYLFKHNHPKSYGSLLRNQTGEEDLPALVYAHLSNDYDEHDKRFFCEGDQVRLQRVPWLLLRSDMYFAPGLFMYPSFRGELGRLFPEKEAVFHLLGRYLFHPADAVWGRVTRYHRAYLAAAGERLGVQIRVFDKNNTPFDALLRQILDCAVAHELLPPVDLRRQPPAHTTTTTTTGAPPPSKAVLLTSLESGYYERIREMYLEHPAVGGVVVGVHQPSQEGVQQTEREAHDVKALAEMYLLGLSDALVTSAWSTFGYAAQGMGGLRPWILPRLGRDGRLPHRAPCVRAASMEPCYDFPPDYDCHAAGGGPYAAGTVEKSFPFLRQCEDLSWGVKMVDMAAAAGEG